MSRVVQGELQFKGANWGGRRRGAGRKPKLDRAQVSHRRREALASRFPVHVTMKLCEGLPSLRRRRESGVLFEVFAKACERAGFRVVQFSLQRDHLHMIVEGKDREALSRGLQGLAIRIAKGLNKLWARVGRVFADRYHDHILRTPREVRNALLYVLQNAKRHGVRLPWPIDRHSSAGWFEGWRERLTVSGLEAVARPIAEAHTWLLKKGWRRHGLRALEEIPGPTARRRPPR